MSDKQAQAEIEEEEVPFSKIAFGIGVAFWLVGTVVLVLTFAASFDFMLKPDASLNWLVVPVLGSCVAFALGLVFMITAIYARLDEVSTNSPP